MAFTKINAAGIGSTELVTLHSLEVLNNATVGGVLTYEDVTNVDSIGLITARNGIVVGSGITLSKDGDIFATGISTISVINSDKIKLGDNEFIHIGVGSDLKLSHDSNNSIITNSTGELLINSSIINLRDTSNNSRLRVEPAGNINIVKNLNVTGITTVSGNVKVGSGITLSPDGHAFVAGVSTIGTLSVSGIVTATGAVDSTTGTVTSSGNMTVGGKLIISGNSAVKDIEYGDGSTTGYFRSITNVNRSNAEASIHMQQFKWNNTKVAEIKVLTGDDTTNKDNAHITFETASAGTTGERLRIASDGNIGINQSNPTAQLQVSGGGAYVVTNSGRSAEGIDIQSSSGDVEGAFGGAISFGLGQTGRSAIAAVQNSSDEDNAGLAFFTHPSNTGAADAEEKMRLTSDGHLLIGTTSTTGISANADDIIIGSIGDSSARGLTFATTASGSIRWADAGDNAMGRIQYDNANDVMTFHTSNATRIRLDSDGGIKFGSDTAAANALDDYEEGDWTPAFKAANNSSSATTEVLDARYTKIGRKVFVCAFIKLTAHATGTTGGLAHITGLPFNNMSEYSAISVGYFANFSANQIFVTGTVQPTSNYIVLRHLTSAAANTTNMDYDNNLQPNSSIIFSVTYHTSA